MVRCLRYVDHDIVPHEEFIGLYRVSKTTGQGIANLVLLRLNLPMTGLVWPKLQWGFQHGREILRTRASSLIRDSLSWVHKLGIFFGQSGKLKFIFEKIATSENQVMTTLKPLCPTRWTVRDTWSI
ncbi:hypothetical protein N1851_022779 [Merluccius polli]|uniref:Uncharacterized protein n=1 Tax=Merluccius polli TaxID=89951 RepID=A0AA47MHP3_MERPO|nr:hypothetical protein N1851_022779 [Merluccius polli]